MTDPGNGGHVYGKCPKGLGNGNVHDRINEVAAQDDAADRFKAALDAAPNDLVAMVKALLGDTEKDPQMLAYARERPMMTRILLGVASTVAARKARLELDVSEDPGVPEISVDRRDDVITVTVKSLDAR